MNQHRLSWAVATAAAVVVAAWFRGPLGAARYEARLGQMARETAALRARLERDLAALNEQLAQYRSAADLLRDPATQVVALRGLGPSPEATGRVLWHPAIGGHLFVAGPPPPAPGKAYALGAIAPPAPPPAAGPPPGPPGARGRRVPAPPGRATPRVSL